MSYQANLRQQLDTAGDRYAFIIEEGIQTQLLEALEDRLWISRVETKESLDVFDANERQLQHISVGDYVDFGALNDSDSLKALADSAVSSVVRKALLLLSRRLGDFSASEIGVTWSYRNRPGALLRKAKGHLLNSRDGAPTRDVVLCSEAFLQKSCSRVGDSDPDFQVFASLLGGGITHAFGFDWIVRELPSADETAFAFNRENVRLRIHDVVSYATLTDHGKAPVLLANHTDLEIAVAKPLGNVCRLVWQ